MPALLNNRSGSFGGQVKIKALRHNSCRTCPAPECGIWGKAAHIHCRREQTSVVHNEHIPERCPGDTRHL
jgi:hypothetical protein